MTDFSELFIKSKGQPIEYKAQKLVLSDQFPVENGDILVATIEKANSDCRQGFCIDITGYCEMSGETFKAGKGVRMLFWADTAPKQIKLKAVTDKGFIWIENIWEKTSSYLLGTPFGESIKKETKSVESRYYGAAMIIEEIENGRRYRCNDWHPDDNFDDIIFTVQKVKK